MADLQKKIKKKYAIDISQDNLFKLYKISSPDLSDEELKKAFSDTRKRWEQSGNGANEKNALRDKARLEKADQYEEILLNRKLRKAVFDYYNSGANERSDKKGAGALSGVGFARAYFELIATTKKLKNDDVEFFFEYFRDEKKNRKAIREMLEQEFNFVEIGKNEGSTEEGSKESGAAGKSDGFVVNLFQKNTITKLKRVIEHYENVKKIGDIQRKYPKINEGLYEFLELSNMNSFQDFTSSVSNRTKEVYAVRQEKGAEYVELVDLFNKLQQLVEHRDVKDNFDEFKILIHYPKLMPYMYAFVDMKKATLKKLLRIAQDEYGFLDETDFLQHYFIPLRDNFGITDGGIRAMIKKAEQRTRANKAVRKINEKRKKKRKNQDEKLSDWIPFGVELVYWLMYYPFFVFYFIFEVIKMAVTNIYKFTVPVFVLLLVWENWFFPRHYHCGTLLHLIKITNQKEWFQYLCEFSIKPIHNAPEMIIMSIIYIVFLLMVYLLPALLISKFLMMLSLSLNKQYDWIGYERSMKQIILKLHESIRKEFLANRKEFYKSRGKKVLVNVFCTILFVVILMLAPGGFRTLQKKATYSLNSIEYEKNVTEVESDGKTAVQQETTGTTGFVEITAGAANIRSGPSTDYEIIEVIQQGTVLERTGQKQIGSDGSTWYELYLNSEKTKVGWGNEQILRIK